MVVKIATKKASKIAANPVGVPKRPLVGAAARSAAASQKIKEDELDEEDAHNIDEHPLQTNNFLVVKYRDDSPRLAKILAVSGKTTETYQYYVHYLDFNRRMDEWVKQPRIMVYPSEANPLGKQKEKVEHEVHKQRQAATAAIAEKQASGAGSGNGATPAEAGGGGNLIGSPKAAGPKSETEAPDSTGSLPRKRGRPPIKRKGTRGSSGDNNNSPDSRERGDELEDPGAGPSLKRGVSNLSTISLASSTRSEVARGASRLEDDEDDDDDNGDGEGVDVDDRGGSVSISLSLSLTGSNDNEGLDNIRDDGPGLGPGIQLQRQMSSGSLTGFGLEGQDRGSHGEGQSMQSLNVSIQENRSSMLSLVAQKALNANETDGGITNMAELEHDEHEGLDEQMLKEHEELTKIKNFNTVQLGKFVMECWYFSPFPKEYWEEAPVECIYFCEFTLRFFRTKKELIRYQIKPGLPRHPPGNEVYRDPKVAMFEIDGAVEKTYCQNLSYFAKLFLDHKTLFEDVDVFLFYVLCTYDDRGYHPVGYFSKNKYSDAGYNLACILTFPLAQRKGFGRFLISFSYVNM